MTGLHDYVVANSRRLKRVAHTIEALLLIAVIAGSSSVGTYWYAQNNFRDEKIAMRQDHLGEIERLQDAYGTRLDRVTSKVSAVAATVEVAANQADAAATLSSAAAKQSAANAQKLNTAVNKVQESLEKVPEPTRAQINRAVSNANKQVQK